MKHLRVNPLRYGKHVWVVTCGRAIWGLWKVWRLSDTTCRDCQRDNEKVNGVGYVSYADAGR